MPWLTLAEAAWFGNTAAAGSESNRPAGRDYDTIPSNADCIIVKTLLQKRAISPKCIFSMRQPTQP